jgi:peptide/nickel transport system ATP-binding protein
VMYAGRIVEEGSVADVLGRPLHPYTMGLLASSVENAEPGEEIAAIAGAPPDLRNLPRGCAFAPRCVYAIEACTLDIPPAHRPEGGRMALCLRAEDLANGTAQMTMALEDMESIATLLPPP